MGSDSVEQWVDWQHAHVFLCCEYEATQQSVSSAQCPKTAFLAPSKSDKIYNPQLYDGKALCNTKLTDCWVGIKIWEWY